MVVSEYFSNFGNDHALVVPLMVFVAVLCLCLIIGHLLEENRWVNESITAILTVISVSLSSLSFSVCVCLYACVSKCLFDSFFLFFFY
jgi:ABC-type dipeptide/oligopeptide/nickel transport system permease component